MSKDPQRATRHGLCWQFGWRHNGWSNFGDEHVRDTRRRERRVRIRRHAQNPLFGGIPTFIASAGSPYRVTVASDGQVYVADWADANSNVWVMDQALVASQNVLDGFDGTSGPRFHASAGQNHGSVRRCMWKARSPRAILWSTRSMKI